MYAGPERQREVASAIGKAAREARDALNALGNIPSDRLDYERYWNSRSRLEVSLRKLLEAVETVNWERTAEGMRQTPTGREPGPPDPR